MTLYTDNMRDTETADSEKEIEMKQNEVYGIRA